MNPCAFNVGDIIEDFYTKDHYKVVEPDKRGMRHTLQFEYSKE